MSDTEKSEHDHIADSRRKVLEAALMHVVFDGWSDETLKNAIADSGVDAGLAKLAFPRGAIDLALAFHYDGDRRLAELMAAEDLSEMRYSERVAHAVYQRLEIVRKDREAVRRGAALFALPQYAGDGAKAIWHTANTIWKVLGDTSRDVNWYTKRATLSAVYSSVVLFWLGDESEADADTRAFIDRRIANVMQFEKTKAKVRETAAYKAFMQGPGRIFEKFKALGEADIDLPGKTEQ